MIFLSKYKKEYNFWTNNLLYPKHRKILSKMSKGQIYENFYRDILFGVAGVRERMSIGISGINIYTIRKMIFSYLKLLINRYGVESLKQKFIIIIHDNRKNSVQYSIEAINIFTNHGINVYINENNDDAPTPFASCMVQYKNAIGAVVITASHNSKIYNGIKFYNKIGAQSPPKDTKLIFSNYRKQKYSFLPPTKLNENSSLVHFLTKKDWKYFLSIPESILINPSEKKTLTIAFSPLYGSARNYIGNIFNKCKYKYYFVKSESVSDSNFGNMNSLNPELLSAYDNVIKLANERNCDVAIICDPDGDRIGIAGKKTFSNDGKFEIISTNKLSIMLLIYMINNNIEVKNKFIYKNFVSNTLIDKIAHKYSINIINLPVGPKWVTNSIYEKRNDKRTLFSFEESCGFIISDLIRDKDSFQAIAIFCEIFNHYKNKGLNFWEFYDKYVAEEFGYLFDERVYLNLDGSLGKKLMSKIMDQIRKKIASKFLGYEVIQKIDYLKYYKRSHQNNLIKIFIVNTDSWIAIRPSRTEPKLKFYINIIHKNYDEGHKIFKNIKIKINNYIEDFNC